MNETALLARADGGVELRSPSSGAMPFNVHPLWLRERVSGGAHVDPLTNQRLYNPADLDPGITVTELTGPCTGRYTIIFSDGVQSAFSATALLAEISGAGQAGLPVAMPWSNADAPPEPTDWRDCEDFAVMQALLETFFTHGYALLTHVPAAHGAVLEVGRRFGFPRETNFGMLFDVRSVPSATDLAYTPLPLDPHTDNPYRAPVPGIQLLHCLCNQTEGGLSTVVDGLAVANALHAQDATLFTSLASTPVRFRYTDSRTELVATAPLIELDQRGAFAAMHYSPRLDETPLLPHAELSVFYHARHMLDGMLRSERFERRFRLNQGDLIMFDNRRLLHGRTEFNPAEGLRHLQGCYIDADGPASLYRVLQRNTP
jgi:gamma-butyrobetaine dioxygenase